ncbi:TCF3 fusion partner like protein [Myotis davidii]|uniref:TCF3 fusion partner like protein n=1 Tax=Myotis davidii TaxID=225400 RepID=L5LY52_MYODS|nr:TCF3 fusion partner like protein [Myotis davidii]
MELEQREGSMAAMDLEEFSAPPSSELALPPLFSGHILESELETEVVTSWRVSLRPKWSSCLGVWAAPTSRSEMKRRRQPEAGGGGANGNSIAGSTRLWIGAAGRSSR